jgi:hypothetical protein
MLYLSGLSERSILQKDFAKPDILIYFNIYYNGIKPHKVHEYTKRSCEEPLKVFGNTYRL